MDVQEGGFAGTATRHAQQMWQAQRGGFTGCRLCRRPLQNSMLGCYDDLSDAKQYSCNLLFHWLGLLFAGVPQLDASPEVNIEVACTFFFRCMLLGDSCMH